MYKYLARPLLFRLSADTTHEATVRFASSVAQHEWMKKAVGSIYSYSDPSLEQNIFGLKFPNPIGIAAGFDKNATMAPVLSKMGFGYLEIGSITANSSTGNPKPRSFRLPADRSLINRLGLNNDGVQTISRRLKKLDLPIPMGINIAKTHDPSITGEDAIQDYVYSFEILKNIADYVTLNISCPNTTEGKTFEEPETLNALLEHLEIGKDSSLPPVLIKFSVDLEDSQLEELISICEDHAIDGYVATNTSSKRVNLKSSSSVVEKIGRGGLSGKAIATRSTEMIRKIYAQTKGEKVIIGVGGISTTEDAIEKLKAGADLLQMYTALVYEGPGIVRKINKGLAQYLEKHGIEHIYHIRKIRD
ncbi:quinone-dependent dihydroorotate dehydrogenase [Rhodohalobacter sp. 614A]|uniref:quinone-dependent dihydroorotate dehydrogenase n=1 Tax=Rhodohalobacter sp. 614A TaxID=2908649 RepID=UPI001F454C30|nr:quinone-dependent dihydroorotate dehydrogenase [Rhodohalobacter sp. 614A]